MKIFISGSRKIDKLPDDFLELLDRIIDDRDTVLVGDCPEGVDRLVQEYLYEHHYGNVIVYTSGTTPRYNVGYDIFGVYSSYACMAQYDTRDYYAIKDKKMTRNCDRGICIWNGKSRATKANIKRLAKAGKRCIVIGFKVDDDENDQR